MGFSRQGYCSGLLCPPPGDLPDTGMEPVSPVSPLLQVDSLPLSHLGSPYSCILGHFSGLCCHPEDKVQTSEYGSQILADLTTAHACFSGTPEEIEAKFGFLVEAYKYGAPPHGGSGMGLDRLAMVMSGADSLRDVLAFPKVQNASELMSGCPAPADAKALADLSIAVIEE